MDKNNVAFNFYKECFQLCLAALIFPPVLTANIFISLPQGQNWDTAFISWQDDYNLKAEGWLLITSDATLNVYLNTNNLVLFQWCLQLSAINVLPTSYNSQLGSMLPRCSEWCSGVHRSLFTDTSPNILPRE